MQRTLCIVGRNWINYILHNAKLFKMNLQCLIKCTTQWGWYIRRDYKANTKWGDNILWYIKIYVKIYINKRKRNTTTKRSHFVKNKDQLWLRFSFPKVDYYFMSYWLCLQHTHLIRKHKCTPVPICEISNLPVIIKPFCQFAFCIYIR